MKGSTKFLVAVGAGAAALLAFRAFLVSPASEAAGNEAVGTANLRAKRAGHFRPAGRPIAEVRKELEAERRVLRELKRSISGIELDIPADLDPGEDGDGGGLNHYQMKRSELTKRAMGGAVSFADPKSPLGLPLVVPEEEVPDYLARIAVARRFLDAAEIAGVASVLRAEHEAIRAGPASGDRETEELPVKVVATADEKSLIKLVYELSQPHRFLALKGLKVEVKDPASGRFQATFELAGVRVVRREPEPGAGGVPVGGVDQPVKGGVGGEGGEDGQAVPAKPRRRRIF